MLTYPTQPKEVPSPSEEDLVREGPPNRQHLAWLADYSEMPQEGTGEVTGLSQGLEAGWQDSQSHGEQTGLGLAGAEGT